MRVLLKMFLGAVIIFNSCFSYSHGLLKEPVPIDSEIELKKELQVDKRLFWFDIRENRILYYLMTELEIKIQGLDGKVYSPIPLPEESSESGISSTKVEYSKIGDRLLLSLYFYPHGKKYYLYDFNTKSWTSLDDSIGYARFLGEETLITTNKNKENYFIYNYVKEEFTPMEIPSNIGKAFFFDNIVSVMPDGSSLIYLKHNPGNESSPYNNFLYDLMSKENLKLEPEINILSYIPLNDSLNEFLVDSRKGLYYMNIKEKIFEAPSLFEEEIQFSGVRIAGDRIFFLANTYRGVFLAPSIDVEMAHIYSFNLSGFMKNKDSLGGP